MLCILLHGVEPVLPLLPHLWSVMYIGELGGPLFIPLTFCYIIGLPLSPALYCDISTFITTKAPTIVLCSFKITNVHTFIKLNCSIVFMCVKHSRRRTKGDHQPTFICKKQIETSCKDERRSALLKSKCNCLVYPMLTEDMDVLPPPKN